MFSQLTTGQMTRNNSSVSNRLLIYYHEISISFADCFFVYPDNGSKVVVYYSEDEEILLLKVES